MALSASATYTGALELLPFGADPTAAAAPTWFTPLLPIYDPDRGHAAYFSHTEATLFRDVPRLDGRLDAAWTSLVAFDADRNSFRPSAGFLLQSWKALTASSAGFGASMAIPLPFRRLVDGTAGSPKELIEAVSSRSCIGSA